MSWKRNKYRVSPKEDRTLDGIVFASKREMQRYAELKELERQGVIRDLVRQPRFPLEVNGQEVCKYVADFCYVDSDDKTVVEDAKGVRTPIYKLKLKLLEAVHGIEVHEV